MLSLRRLAGGVLRYGANWWFSLLCLAVSLAGVQAGPTPSARLFSLLLLTATLVLTGLRWRLLSRRRGWEEL